MNKFLALLCTASPGLQKLLLMAVGVYFWGATDAGTYAEDFAVVYFVALFASLGYGASLQKQIPRVQKATQIEMLRLALGASALSAATIYVLGCMLFYFWPTINIVFSFHILLFTTACAIQQVTRSHFLASRGYQALLCFDSIVLFAQIAPIFLLSLDSYYQVVSVVNIILISAIGLSISKGIKLSRKSIFDYESFQFAINNLVSGGVPVILPKIISYKYHGEVVAITTLYLSALSFLTTGARGYINYKLPSMSRIIGRGQKFKVELIQLRDEMQKIIFVSILAGLVAYLPLNVLLGSVDALSSYDIELITYTSILLFVTSGAFGLADSSVLFLLGKQRHNIESNLIYFASFFIMCILFIAVEIYSLEYLLFTLATLSALRSQYVKLFCEKYIC